MQTREVLELAALKSGIKVGGGDWEAGILAALHRLNRLDSGRGARAFADFPTEYDDLHKEFHAALIAACGSPRMIRLHDMLYEQTFRYRSLVMSKDARISKLADEHGEIARLVIERKVRPACDAVRAHLHSLLDAYSASDYDAT